MNDEKRLFSPFDKLKAGYGDATMNSKSHKRVSQKSFGEFLEKVSQVAEEEEADEIASKSAQSKKKSLKEISLQN